MHSLILRTATRSLTPLLLLFSIFLLLRGHNESGGGFVGGLIAGNSFILYAIAYGTKAARQAIRFEPQMIIGVGLLLALLSGFVPVLIGLPFLTGVWGYLPIFGGSIELGTPLFFDIGVYLTVLGVTLTIILTLAEE